MKIKTKHFKNSVPCDLRDESFMSSISLDNNKQLTHFGKMLFCFNGNKDTNIKKNVLSSLI